MVLVFIIQSMEIVATIIIMKHDVESKPKGNDEQRIPEQKEEEGIENFVEHGNINIAMKKLRMSPNQGYQLSPGEDNGNGSKMSVKQNIVPIVVTNYCSNK